MDREHDAERIHEAVRDAGAKSIISVRRQKPGFQTRGRHRGQTRREFESGSAQKEYGQRSKTETVFSVIKRMFGSAVRSHSVHARETELLYRVLAYNYHRACMISCVVFLMISMEPSVQTVGGMVTVTASNGTGHALYAVGGTGIKMGNRGEGIRQK